MQVLEVAVEQFAEVRASGAFLANVHLHCVDVVGACSEVVHDGAVLLHFLSEEAVEGHAGFEETHIVLAESDLSAHMSGKRGEFLVVGTQCQVLVLHVESGVLLTVHTSEHLDLINNII